MTNLAESIIQTRYRATLHGLISGFAMLSDQQIQHLTGDDLDAALARPNGVVWLHFNARVGHARDWIVSCEHLPEASRWFLLDTDDRKRLERRGDCLMGVISDIRYDFGLDFDPEQIAALRFHLDRGCLISTRREPCSAADQLRTEINNGRHFDSPAKLMIHLFESQVAKLNETTARVRGMLDDIEEQVLVGQMRGQHVQLGGIRRLAVRLNLYGSIPRSLLRSLVTQYPAACCGVVYSSFRSRASDATTVVSATTRLVRRGR